MRQALRNNRVEDVLGYLMVSSRPAFRSQFKALGKNLPAYAEKIGEIHLVRVTDDLFAECDLRHKKGGKTYSFIVQFMRDYDVDNEWRIRTF